MLGVEWGLNMWRGIRKLFFGWRPQLANNNLLPGLSGPCASAHTLLYK